MLHSERKHEETWFDLKVLGRETGMSQVWAAPNTWKLKERRQEFPATRRQVEGPMTPYRTTMERHLLIIQDIVSTIEEVVPQWLLAVQQKCRSSLSNWSYTHKQCAFVCVCVHNLIKKGLCKVSKTSTMCYLHHFSFIRQHVIHRLKVVLLEMFDQRRNWCHMQKRKILPFQEEKLFPMSSIIAIHQPNSLASITCWIRPTTGPCPGSSLGLGNAQDIVQHKWQA